ncbi:carbamoyltransferase [Kitasatospora sp. NPDC058444]|uniref:carbamoyltransferase family protein n=1 Tax=Kitasatospora sp. NPDC058444 TaxID=3346504 RepID=UPI0036643AB3
MITLGITGSFAALAGARLRELPDWFFHDAAAALVVDGVTVAAVEEERLNRVKHTTAFPDLAIRACLHQAGITLAQVDEVAFFFGEEYADLELGHQYVERPAEELAGARELLVEGLERSTGSAAAARVPIGFVPHHLAHGFGSWADSGFDDSLVVVVDGNGEAESISVFLADGGLLTPLATYPIEVSLGHLYLETLPLMGFRRFDEYKVMGLAPYGDPAVHRADFARFVAPLPDGGLRVERRGMVEHFLRAGFTPRRAHEPPRQADADLAAALQEVVEGLLLNLLGHWRRTTGLRRLCLSGGVAHNSSANGRVLASGLFDEVFVHPASHDAGAALGAAQFRQQAAVRRRARRRVPHVFWGPSMGERAEVERALARWLPLVDARPVPDGKEAALAAELIADGAVLGWATGRSEFGPRALGHRSILADPRAAENRDRVNAKIKKREGFRPFAPAVLEERAEEVFDLGPTGAALGFMSYVVAVRPEWRERLPAVTHVDGTARVQLAGRTDNPELWDVISEFEARTGVPVVLNTSFNNFAEPIVQSVDDVVRCLLTTELDGAVLPGHHLLRRPGLLDALPSCSAVPLPATQYERVWRRDGGQSVEDAFTVRLGTPRSRAVPIGRGLWELLADGGPGPVLLGDARTRTEEERRRLPEDVMRLWEHRCIEVIPPS